MLYLAQLTFEHESALPADRIVNTLWFDLTDHDTPAMANIDAAIDAAFTDDGVGGYNVKSYLSDALAGSLTVRWYRHADAEPRSPEHVSDPITWTETSAQALPSEVAVCLSFQANPVSGLSQANRRGRIYVGPLNVNAIADVGNTARVAPNFRTALLDAAQVIHDAAEAEGGTWRVYSRVNDTSVPVDVAWVDNAFDTQRRRGEKTTARTTRSL